MRIRSLAAAASLLGLAACAPALDVATSFPNPVAVVAAPFVPPENPQALIGRSGREVAGWLGEPQLKRRDPPAELWQYRAPACTVDFFLYADKALDEGSAGFEVSHVEVRPREVDARACLSAIRASGRRGIGG